MELRDFAPVDSEKDWILLFGFEEIESEMRFSLPICL